jgi:hypothetical protein
MVRHSVGKRLVLAVLCGVAVTALGGCLGPFAVYHTRARYNEVIQCTNNEELLLNLVRLRYLENPGFLPVTGLTAQFEGSLGATYRNGVDRGPLYSNYGEGQLGFADRPTLSFAPQRSPELTKGLLNRIPLEVLYLFSANGEDVDRDLRLFVRNINGIENAGDGGGPTPATPPEFAEFRQVTGLIRELRHRRAALLGEESREVELPFPVPLDARGTPDLAAIKAAGYGLKALPDGKGYVLTQTKTVRVLRIRPDAVAWPEVLELTRLLRLRPGLTSYDVEEILEGQFPPTDEADGQRTKITMTMRSVLEVMYILSQTVRVPPEHVCAGLVPVTADANGTSFDWDEVIGDLFQVQWSKRKPKKAFVAVCYRGYWFYLDDCDAASKVTLGLFADLFRLQRLGAAEGQPLLTLPVGR